MTKVFFALVPCAQAEWEGGPCRNSVLDLFRRRMFQDCAAISGGRLDAHFTVIDAWFKHTDEQKHAYVQDILNSKFVLCPRGQGTGSHRLFEVMQLARVPVIISDDWVAPPGAAWGEFSLRIAESEVRSISKQLANREPAFLDMAMKARKAWEEFFAPERRLSLMLDWLVLLSAERPNPVFDYRLRWSRRSFYNGNIGTIWDRARRRFQLR